VEPATSQLLPRRHKHDLLHADTTTSAATYKETKYSPWLTYELQTLRFLKRSL
jgi:hypothetical protein